MRAQTLQHKKAGGCVYMAFPFMNNPNYRVGAVTKNPGGDWQITVELIPQPGRFK